MIAQNISPYLHLFTEYNGIDGSKSRLTVYVEMRKAKGCFFEVQPLYLLAAFHEVYSAAKS